MPRGVRLGRNVKVGERVRSADFATRVVKSGGTVERRAGDGPARRVAIPAPPPARVSASAPD